ncbi:MAG TPA: hypothetical protein PKV48_01125, partial [Thermodesulfobacteriota bacterium]|nr:hypothetical protein [Thermodesulfobacteriota bacterium]
MLKKFFSLNKTICRKLLDCFPHLKNTIYDLYEKAVTDYLNLKQDQIIVDIGGGKCCPFAAH